MANKKNNQNRKSTEGPAMNGNNATAASATIQNAPQNLQGTNFGSSSATQNNNNNSSAGANGTAINAPASATSNSMNTSYSQHNQSQNHQSHHRPSSTSSSSQHSSSKQPMKRHNEVEKISNSALSQSGFRNAGNKDQRTKEKEKTPQGSGGGSGRQGGQHHHHNSNHSGGGGNQQNARKKDNKNRDLSNQSHRGGGFTNSYGNHHQQHQSSNSIDNARFSSNASLASTVGPTSTSPTPVASVPPPVFLESKTVQTDEKQRKEKPKSAKKEIQFKSSDPKYLDTVMAFKEHDEWDKVELICELMYLLSPTDLRLVSNCIEGSTRPYSNQMKQIEKTLDLNDPTACLPPYICFPRSQQDEISSTAPDSTSSNQRTTVNSLFGQQYPPGLPPLIGTMPNIVFASENNYNQPSSSTTPSSSVSTTSKEVGNKVTVANSSTGSAPSDGQQQDSSKNSARGASITSQPSSTATTEQDDNSNSVTNPVRPQSTSTPQLEPRVPQDPEKFLPAIRDLTSYLYILMSVCSSTNRRSAEKISEYVINVVWTEKTQILERVSNELDKIDIIQDIGKIISAMTHHPAVSLKNKLVFTGMRDELRAEIEALFRNYYSVERVNERRQEAKSFTQGVGDIDDEEDSEEYEDEEEEYGLARRYVTSDVCSRSHDIPAQNSSRLTNRNFFITRFIGRQIEKNDDAFSLEIHWSDGDCTFAQRTRDQLKALQHRLLDEFGQQRSEKSNHHHGMASSISSFDEDNKKLSASTSTMETSFVPTGERIVPRLARDATPAQYIQYINELSDLPARMMLSSVICEEFNGTRSRTEDENQDSSNGLIFSRWKNPRAKSPVRYYERDTHGNIVDVVLPKVQTPFLYSNIPQSQMQTINPSCSNCGGQHLLKDCGKPTLLERKASVDYKMRMDHEGAVAAPSSQHGGNASSNVYSQMHAIPMQLYVEAPGMLGQSHYNHQQQQIIQTALYHNGGQYRANGQYDGPLHAPLMYFAPNIPTTTGSTGNNSNAGGTNQNNNF